MVAAMISHVVLMTPRRDLMDADRRAFVESFERAVREIPSVRGVRVGRRVLIGAGYEKSGAAAADYLAIIDFDNVEGLASYLHHPAHADLGARFSASLASAAVYDFESGGLEMIEAWLPRTGDV
jgi:stress responsive alpha/beta barrel protein